MQTAQNATTGVHEGGLRVVGGSGEHGPITYLLYIHDSETWLNCATGLSHNSIVGLTL